MFCQLNYTYIFTLSGKELDGTGYNDTDYQNCKSDGQRAPERCKNPPPRPCDDVAEFEGDENKG